MGNKYRIAFRGEVAEGFSEQEVRATLAARLNRGDEIIDRMFSGNLVTLAKDLDFDNASEAATKLARFGAVVYLVDASGHAVRAPMPADDEPLVESPSASSETAPEAESDAIAEPEVPEEPPKSEASSSEAFRAEQDADNSDPYNLSATAKVRHLQQITESPPAVAMPAKEKRKARFRYRFDTFMAKGGGSIFKALTAVFLGTFLLIGLMRGALLLMFPEVPQQHDELGFFGNLYITFLEITDPGNMAQDIYSNFGYQIFAIMAGIAGIVMLSALIAFITTALDQKIHELKRGRSKVIETGHTLILGWNEQRIVEIVR